MSDPDGRSEHLRRAGNLRTQTDAQLPHDAELRLRFDCARRRACVAVNGGSCGAAIS